ncbi:MATE family efflux transporter [Pseudorhodobacter turbinis]|uniref:MATE family efflux transporter n=1 Tax=Pseudorhodobacter turbinis TaxID=2500533 RepID=A0A4P8EGB3_9RHOB|nr:MATE family efflux transporter [Pseudorhodobacter turbinis]QCO55753.1 MATE family efflux transporter [Pseudorhodobacter turbinis]
MKITTNATLFQLSYPLFLQSLVMFTVMVIDMMIWSAHSPDTAAALSVAGQVLRVAVELSAVMGIGAVITISQQLGSGQTDAARLTADIACTANAILGGVMGVLLAVMGPWILKLMTLSAEIEASATTYLYFSGATMVFLFLGNAAVACLRGFGQSRTVMALSVLGAVLYLSLEYLLVLGAGPVPALGVTGAGAANLVTRVVVSIVLVILLARALGLRFSLRQMWNHIAKIRRFAALALPSVSDFVAYGFYQMILLGVIATQGEVAVLSRAYVMIAMSFLTMVIMAVCQGSEVLIGYRLGAGNTKAAQRQGLRSSWIAAALSTICAIMIFAAVNPFIHLFTDDPEVLELSRRLLWLTIFLQPCFAFNMILFHALRAIEDVRWPVLASQSLSWLFGLPLAWFLCVPMGLGIIGVWYAFIAEELCKAAVMLYRWTKVS